MKKSFTIVEILVIIIILAILAAMATPTFLGLKRRAELKEVKMYWGLFLAAAKQYDLKNNGDFSAINNAAVQNEKWQLLGLDKQPAAGTETVCEYYIRQDTNPEPDMIYLEIKSKPAGSASFITLYQGYLVLGLSTERGIIAPEASNADAKYVQDLPHQ